MGNRYILEDLPSSAWQETRLISQCRIPKYSCKVLAYGQRVGFKKKEKKINKRGGEVSKELKAEALAK